MDLSMNRCIYVGPSGDAMVKNLPATAGDTRDVG